MASYLRLEVLRTLRDPKYIILAVLSPIGFYLLFSTLFGGQSTGSAGMTVQAGLMVSMGLYGAMWAVMSATGPRIAQDRTVGWARQMRLLPIRTSETLVARLIAAVALAGPAIVLVMLTAVFAKGVTLDDAWRWVVLLALLWLGSIPVALLGIAIGYSIGPEVAFGVLYALYLALSALGGLWMPLSIILRHDRERHPEAAKGRERQVERIEHTKDDFRTDAVADGDAEQSDSDRAEPEQRQQHHPAPGVVET